jgi:hypothetical protein
VGLQSNADGTDSSALAGGVDSPPLKACANGAMERSQKSGKSMNAAIFHDHFKQLYGRAPSGKMEVLKHIPKQRVFTELDHEPRTKRRGDSSLTNLAKATCANSLKSPLRTRRTPSARCMAEHNV